MGLSLSIASDGFLGRGYHILISASEGLPDLMVSCLDTLPALIVSCLSTLPAFVVSCLSMAAVLVGCGSLLLQQHLHTSAICFVKFQVRLKSCSRSHPVRGLKGFAAVVAFLGVVCLLTKSCQCSISCESPGPGLQSALCSADTRTFSMCAPSETTFLGFPEACCQARGCPRSILPTWMVGLYQAYQGSSLREPTTWTNCCVQEASTPLRCWWYLYPNHFVVLHKICCSVLFCMASHPLTAMTIMQYTCVYFMYMYVLSVFYV